MTSEARLKLFEACMNDMMKRHPMAQKIQDNLVSPSYYDPINHPEETKAIINLSFDEFDKNEEEKG